MIESANIARPPSRLLSHTALGLLQPGNGLGNSLSRPGTSAFGGAPSLRQVTSCPVFISPPDAEKEGRSPWLAPPRISSPNGGHSRRSSDLRSTSSHNETALSKSLKERSQLRKKDELAGGTIGCFFSPPRSEGLPSRDTLEHPFESMEALAEEFNRSARAIDHQIDDISRSLRFDHLALNKEEAMEREQREAERRRRDAEMRKARKREQAARNPQKKVALRLENTRRFAPDAEQNNNIPLQRIDVNSIKGCEMVEVVDVQMLKSRCLALQEGASVQTLMELMRTREQKAKLVAGQSSMSMPDLRGTPPNSPFNLTWEARREKAVLQREVTHFGKIACRLTSMRRQFTKALPYDIEGSVNQRIMQLSETSWSDKVSAIDKVTSQMRPRAKSRPNIMAGCVRQKTRGRNHFEMVRLTTRRVWSIVRAHFWWLVLMFHVRRKNAAMEVVKTTISQCGEWSRLRFAMHRLTRTVKGLQQRGRDFLRLKQIRLDAMQNQWQRIEDVHVEAYCLAFATQALREKYGDEQQARRYLLSAAQDAKMKGKQVMHQKLKENVVKLNWKQFRIPMQERRDILSRYYMVSLKKHLRIQTSIVTMMRRIVQSQREMVGYLKEFGAELKSGQSLTSDDKVVADVKHTPWWHLSEDITLQLIALCAKELKDSGTEPFQDHPAHIDIPGNAMYFSSLQEAAMLLAPVGSGRGTTRPQRKTMTTEQDKATKKPAWTRKLGQRADIEDVFGLFTPRLREITEKQSLEYRTSNPARAATPLATVA